MSSSNGTFSALLAICVGNSPVLGEFPTQRPVTRSFDVYFELRPNKRLNKQWWGWSFEMQSRPLWRHRNVVAEKTGGWPWKSQGVLWGLVARPLVLIFMWLYSSISMFQYRVGVFSVISPQSISKHLKVWGRMHKLLPFYFIFFLTTKVKAKTKWLLFCWQYLICNFSNENDSIKFHWSIFFVLLMIYQHWLR